MIKSLVCGLSGLAALIVLSVGAPQCVGDSFQNLDPLVRRYWFDRTAEGLPIFHLGLDEMIGAIVVLLLGLCGIVHLIRSSAVPNQTKTALILTFVATALVATYVSRTLAYFIIIASVILAPLSAHLFARVSEQAILPVRLFWRMAAIALLLPFMTGQIVASAAGRMQPAPDSSQPSRFAVDIRAAKLCQDTASIKQLRRLPTSRLLVGLDVAPAILQHTGHSVVASGHHRNQHAMRDVITAFTATPESLASILKTRKIDYVAVCGAAPEFIFYKALSPQGNWAQLDQGAQLEKLVEQRALGPFRIWRVGK